MQFAKANAKMQVLDEHEEAVERNFTESKFVDLHVRYSLGMAEKKSAAGKELARTRETLHTESKRLEALAKWLDKNKRMEERQSQQEVLLSLIESRSRWG